MARQAQTPTEFVAVMPTVSGFEMGLGVLRQPRQGDVVSELSGQNETKE